MASDGTERNFSTTDDAANSGHKEDPCGATSAKIRQSWSIFLCSLPC
jgi:hypothetical protein